MKFNSTAGQELRTWILFFVGIALAIIFALNGNPLNPWWTLVIGAFTCTAVIVSAVQALSGGMTDAARKAVHHEEPRRTEPMDRDAEQQPPSSTLSVMVGPRLIASYVGLCGSYASSI